MYIPESVVAPNQKQYPWYHQTYRRVPTIDQCYTDDHVCRFEANQQFKRDRLVDNEVLSILRQRFEDCMLYEGPDGERKCRSLYESYQRGAENWFTKCMCLLSALELRLSLESPAPNRFLLQTETWAFTETPRVRT